MSKEDKKEEKIKSLPCWVYWVWLIAIVSLSLSLLCCCVFVFPYTNWEVNAVSTGIVLTFVGILATFVVISNYMQVKDVKDEYKDSLSTIKLEYDAKINTLEEKMEAIIEKKINIAFPTENLSIGSIGQVKRIGDSLSFLLKDGSGIGFSLNRIRNEYRDKKQDFLNDIRSSNVQLISQGSISEVDFNNILEIVWAMSFSGYYKI